MNTKNIILKHQDCLEFLKSLPDKSVELVLIDPPYGISQTDRFSTGGDPRFHNVNLYFGDWDNTFDCMEDVVKECYRVLKPSGTFISFYDIWKISELKSFMVDAKFKQLRFIEWIKTNPVPIQSKNNYLNSAREVAVVGVKGTCPTFNSSYDNGVYQYGVYHGKDRFHTTQKPVELIEELIKKHSNAGDTVLDCFSGSGTTAIACMKTGRKFVGCELDDTYYAKSIDRINKLKKDAA